jgi:signal transduction histidine kinase
VQDEGIGIPIEDQQKLFESFARASNVGAIAGTGLGLSIVKKCVNLHGGQITVESKVSAGTTFTVSLPLDKQPMTDDQ